MPGGWLLMALNGFLFIQKINSIRCFNALIWPKFPSTYVEMLTAFIKKFGPICDLIIWHLDLSGAMFYFHFVLWVKCVRLLIWCSFHSGGLYLHCWRHCPCFGFASVWVFPFPLAVSFYLYLRTIFWVCAILTSRFPLLVPGLSLFVCKTHVTELFFDATIIILVVIRLLSTCLPYI